jgi:hypothetical protein
MTVMIFERRELKAYAEPISVDQLNAGSIYFFVNFVDEEMLIPTIEPVVYVGRNFEPDDADQVYFQDVSSFRRGVRYDTASEGDEAVFHSGSENELGHVFEYDRALDVLLACSIRRSESAKRT